MNMWKTELQPKCQIESYNFELMTHTVQLGMSTRLPQEASTDISTERDTMSAQGCGA